MFDIVKLFMNNLFILAIILSIVLTGFGVIMLIAWVMLEFNFFIGSGLSLVFGSLALTIWEIRDWREEKVNK